MSTSGSKSNEHVAHFLVDIHNYAQGINGLPKADVVKFMLEDNCSVIVRPSGTEPKIKVYVTVCAESEAIAEKCEKEIKRKIEQYF